MATTQHHAICPLCEATCGLTVDVADGKLTKIRGDEEDPFSRGYLCPKAAALGDIHDDPDRIRAPLRREGTRWREIGWDLALAEATERLAAIQAEHGADAVAFYVGNPTVHDYSASLLTLGFMQALGSKNVFTSNSVDGLPRLLCSYLLYGGPATIPVPDLDRTAFLLVVGANPLVSNGSIMTAPDCKRRLGAIRERGGRIVVVDPRRTETARFANEHHFIRPGADALLLAALVHTIFEEGLGATAGGALGLADGLDAVRGAVARFPPERVAAAVGIAAGAIRELARAFAAAPSAVCYGRMGTSTHDFGTTTTWLIDVLNLVTGNLDREGGAMFASPAIDLAKAARRARRLGLVGFDRWRSRVRGLPEMNGELPCAAMAEEMDTPGPGQIRALVTHAGNPVLSLPNGRRLDRALGRLDYMVAIDLYKNETTRHADLILPTTFALEHEHYPLVFQALSVRNNVKYAAAVVPPPPGVRHSWEVLLDLATGIVARRGGGGRLAAVAARRAAHALGGPRGFIRSAIRFGARGAATRGGAGGGLTLERIAASPHGIDLGGLVPRLAELLGGGRVAIAPPVLLADLDRLALRLAGEAASIGRGELLLVSRRHLRSNNSWMHNSLRLVKGRNRCTLLIHPRDATARGVSAGDRVRIASNVGAVEAEAEITDEMMPGVVSLPHGWGHDRGGADLEVARSHAGVSLNDVTDDAKIDPVSGCVSFSDVRVEVSRVGAAGVHA